MSKKIQLSDDLEQEVDALVDDGMFNSFQAAVDELIRLGLTSIRRRETRNIPPGTIPSPERPNIPDPTRDILKM